MRYALVGRLGRGGMGVVDLATDEDGTHVALKRLPLHGSARETALARRRIRREAEVLRSLDHPAIVRLLDVVDDEDDVILVMPHLAGGTLAERVQEHGPMSAHAVEQLGLTLLGALAAAHRQGVVHRDVKPSNVLFDLEGRPHLADFGVASSRDATDGLTGVGLVVGTPRFMAPEQARGEVIGPAADVFALGATLRFALTGSGPWGPDGPGAQERAAAGRVVRLAKGVAPPSLDRLLRAMCQPDARRRPSAADLAGGPAGTFVRTTHQPVLGRGRRTPSARAMAVAGGATLALLALVGGGSLLLGRDGGADGAGDGEGSAGTATVTAAPTTACQDLPYQPCGGEPAPGTDGVACIDDRGDFDGDPTNGCEAVPDGLDGSVLEGIAEANLVPADDVDVYELDVVDQAQLLCDGTLRLTLTAPAGVAQRLEVLRDDEELARVGSTDGTPASLELVEPGCFSDDSATLEVRVSSIGADRTGQPYLLEVDGSY